MANQAQAARNNLRYLFDRPSQPIFQPKGRNSTISFDVPTNYYTDRYRPIKDQLQTRMPGGTVIPVRELAQNNLPDIRAAMSLDRKSNFSVFNDMHKDCATNLINAFMVARNTDELMSVACYAQPRVNPYLYIYALTVALLHRQDTRGISLPPHVCTFPELYVDGTVLAEARSASVLSEEHRTPIEIPKELTASDANPENRLSYFREDIGLNTHHWHWHLLYPSDGPANIVNKDRRGELFYYMHQQIIARYNLERLSNALPRVGRLDSFYDPIPEGYFPKLDSVTASRIWPSRQSFAVPSSVNREADGVFIEIDNLVRYKDRIYEAIHRGSVFRGATDLVPLQESDGIDILGNLLESNSLSVNRSFYGSFHNSGHNLLGFVHDPDNRYLESVGVIGENATSLRDPVFYRWHTTINDIFETYKNTLTPYTTQQLGFDGIQVTGLEVNDGANPVNNLQTYWEVDQVDLSRGVDFVPSGPIYARFTHLQHTPFTYRVTVQNSGAQRIGTARIFMGPKRDERGISFRFRDQRRLFIELDRFTTTLRAGTNTIQRRSTESTLTIPFEFTFRYEDNIPLTSSDEAQNFIFCGCGWPNHLLLPKGTPEGMLFDLFVMFTDYNQTDRVENTSLEATPDGCDAAFSFCGLRNSRYPDRRAMGFPFDRPERPGTVTLEQFLTPNMRSQEVRIRFVEKTLDGVSITQGTSTQTNQNRPNANQTQSRPNQNTGRPGNQGQQQPSRPTTNNRRP